MVKTMATLSVFALVTVVVLTAVDLVLTQGMLSVSHSSTLTNLFTQPHLG